MSSPRLRPPSIPDRRQTRLHRWFASIRVVMILLVALATIFPLGVIFQQNHRHEKQAYHEGRIQSERIAAEVAYEQQLLLASAKQLMSTFSYNAVIRSRNAVAVNRFLADLLQENPQITNIVIADEKGIVWASGLPIKAPFSVADRRYFRNAMATGRFSSGEFNIGRIRDKPTILFGYPLKDGSGRITDVAVVSLSSDQYERLFRSKELFTEASLALFDHKGVVIYSRPSSAQIGKPDREDLFRRMAEGPDEGSFEAVGLAGIRRVLTFRKLRLPGESEPYMYVRAGISVSLILGRTRKEFLIGMGSIVLSAMLILFLTVLLGKRFVLEKVVALKEATERLSRGDMDIRVAEVVSGGELGELGTAFDHMAERLQEADAKRREAEEASRRQAHAVEKERKEFQAILDAAPVMIAYKSKDDRFLWTNQAFAQFLGLSLEEIIGKTTFGLVQPREVAQKGRDHDLEVIRTGIPVTDQLVKWSGPQDREERWGLYSKVPISDSDGDIIGTVSFVTDIDTRVRAEEALRDTTRRLQLAASSGGFGIWEWDIPSDALHWDGRMFELYGLAGDTPYKGLERWQKCLHPDDVDMAMEASRAAIRGEKEYDSAFRIVHPDGAVRFIQANAVLIRDAAGKVLRMVGINRDITERKKTEEDLRNSEYRFKVLTGQSPLGMALIDGRGRYEYVNPAFEAIFGYALEDLPTGAEWFRVAFPDPAARGEAVKVWKEDLVRAGIGVSRPRVFDVVCKGGAVRTVLFRPVALEGNRQIVIYEDITERRKMESQLQHAMKMEAVGRLAGGVAHDFNNLLTVIIGNVSLALGKVQASTQVAGMLSEVNKAAERAAHLTQQLLAFSRKQIIEPKVLDPNVLIAEVSKMLVRLIGEHIELITVPGERLGAIKVDPGQFQQILMNLAVNARDAMPEGGKITITTTNVDLDEGDCVRNPDMKPGRFVMLSVSDTGQGMSEEVRAHIFEPFFTTKERGTGTGLGLATTYGVVQQAGGAIEVHSEVGLGTTFNIYLPRVEKSAARPVEADPPRDLPGGTETVLLVEDEDVVRDLCVRILERLGYKVLPAASGAAATALALGYGDRIDLLLTDVVMPGMNGAELATQLVLRHPEMKVLFTSGYTDEAISHRGVLDEGVSFIPKPYTPLELARKVREVLEKVG